jgi:ribosomal protein S18 acetylase RimI-like enzyme
VGQIGIRRATIKDASAIATIHDEAWRLAYRGIIPGANLERMIERRGPAWWLKALERRTAVLVLEVSGKVCGYATIGPSRMRMLPFGGELYELYLKPEHMGGVSVSQSTERIGDKELPITVFGWSGS